MIVALLALSSAIVHSLATEPSPAPEPCERGRFCLDKGDFDAAIAAYTEAIRRDPSNAIAYCNRGRCYIVKDDLDKALADLTESIRLDPKDSTAYLSRAAVYLITSDTDNAISDCTEAIRLSPRSVEAYSARGIAYISGDKLENAIADLDQAIGLDPKYTVARLNRALVYARRGEDAKAISEFTETIRINPKYSEAYIRRGRIYAGKRDYAAAIADYTQAIGLRPTFPCYYEIRGSLQIAQGDYDRGVADIRTAIRLNPKDQAAKFENWPKKPISDNARRHGEEQLHQMLKDREAMGKYGKLAEPLYQWAIRKFAGEDLGEEIYWGNDDPPSPLDGCHRPPTENIPGCIYIRENYGNGRDVGKRRSFEELWCIAVFELYNITSVEDFALLNHRASTGELSKEQYVVKRIDIELRAAEKTRSFYIHVFLPWAREHSIATDPFSWYLATRLHPSQSLVPTSLDKKGAVWRYQERSYDSVIAREREKRK